MHLEKREMSRKQGSGHTMTKSILFVTVCCSLHCYSGAWHGHNAIHRPLQTRMNGMNLRIQSSAFHLVAGRNRGKSESRLHMTATERETFAADGKEESGENGANLNVFDGISNINGQNNVFATTGDTYKEGESPESDGSQDALTETNGEVNNEPTNGEEKQDKKPDFAPDHRICRVVALPDGKLPTTRSELPSAILEPRNLLDKLDAIYHAMSYEETRRLRYVERSKSMEPVIEEEEEQKLVSVLRNSLEDAGFELLSRRDVDLCEALNAGYLLRLSIAPDVSDFDPTIATDFYPEWFDEDGYPKQELLFEGRVLLYRRGYSAEVTEGRLLLPKLDYLQASIVQRAARTVTQVIGRVERQVLSTVTAISRHTQIFFRNQLAKIADIVPNASVARFLRVKWGWKKVDKETLAHDKEDMANIGFFKFSRYGGESQNRFLGSPGTIDALDPFLSCDVTGIDAVNGEYFGEVNGGFNSSEYPCQYDFEDSSCRPSSCQDEVLLERVSINNVVDLSTRQGRRTLVKRFFAKSKLVEPTFEEVVAIWRPLPDNPKPKFLPPKFVYSIAEIFEVDDKLPEFEKPPPDVLPAPLEIRSYDDVPMANAPAVLPKTKLLFRPADAFVFDFITLLSAAAVIGSQRFDSHRLDLLAIISGTLWVIRTIIRYSNKLARYELLVKKFLTSKISHRNSGALKYISREAGNQRATRAALVYLWISEKVSRTGMPIPRSSLLEKGSAGVNEFIQANDAYRGVRVDIDAALNDLVDLDLIGFSLDGQRLIFVRDEEAVVETLKRTWDNVFEQDLSLNRLVGRRSREPTAE